MATIKPTRSELMELKKKIALAKNGHSLLKRKRDGMILDFFKIFKKIKDTRQELADEYKKAIYAMNIARMLESDIRIKSIALSIPESPTVELSKKNIMGVKVPSIGEIAISKPSVKEGFGIYGSAAIDEARSRYQKVIEKVIRQAEIEISMRRLLAEIEKTKRRVNALEFEIIPRMQHTKNIIQLRLEEVERENLFRMKRIKKKQENVTIT